jgi:glycosyltransferase involved in cell wall biosynthesis
MPMGIDKGFNVFIEYAELLSSKYEFVRFHVVGGFTKEDITQSINTTNFTFYGYSDFEFFKKFYAEIDLFVSPNKPFAKGGIFDGFPLGTSIEAGICGSVVMMSDLLNENESFVDNHDFLLINNEIDEMLRKTDRLISNPEIMQSFVVNFRESIFKFSNNNIALTKKNNFIKNVLKEIK